MVQVKRYNTLQPSVVSMPWGAASTALATEPKGSLHLIPKVNIDCRCKLVLFAPVLFGHEHNATYSAQPGWVTCVT